MAQSSDELISQVITEVQQYPILWQIGLDVYKRGDMKENAWLAISAKIGLPAKEVRDIWAKTRIKFNKLKKDYDLAVRSGAAAVAEPEWPFYSSCKFLIGNSRKTKQRETVSTINVQDILAKVQEQSKSKPSTSSTVYMDSRPLVIDDEQAGILEEANLPEGSFTIQSLFQLKENEEPSNTAKKARYAETQSDHSDFLGGVQKILSQIPLPQPTEQSLNPDIIFGNFVATSLAEMDKEKKNKTKKRITELLFE